MGNISSKYSKDGKRYQKPCLQPEKTAVKTEVKATKNQENTGDMNLSLNQEDKRQTMCIQPEKLDMGKTEVKATENQEKTCETSLSLNPEANEKRCLKDNNEKRSKIDLLFEETLEGFQIGCPKPERASG